MTDKGGRYEGKEIKFFLLKEASTVEQPVTSDSSMGTYKNKLAGFRDHNNLLLVEPNNVAG